MSLVGEIAHNRTENGVVADDGTRPGQVPSERGAVGAIGSVDADPAELPVRIDPRGDRAGVVDEEFVNQEPLFDLVPTVERDQDLGARSVQAFANANAWNLPIRRPDEILRTHHKFSLIGDPAVHDEHTDVHLTATNAAQIHDCMLGRRLPDGFEHPLGGDDPLLDRRIVRAKPLKARVLPTAGREKEGPLPADEPHEGLLPGERHRPHGRQRRVEARDLCGISQAVGADNVAMQDPVDRLDDEHAAIFAERRDRRGDVDLQLVPKSRYDQPLRLRRVAGVSHVHEDPVRGILNTDELLALRDLLNSAGLAEEQSRAALAEAERPMDKCRAAGCHLEDARCRRRPLTILENGAENLALPDVQRAALKVTRHHPRGDLAACADAQPSLADERPEPRVRHRLLQVSRVLNGPAKVRALHRNNLFTALHLQPRTGQGFDTESPQRTVA